MSTETEELGSGPDDVDLVEFVDQCLTPFPKQTIGKLPKRTCRACAEAKYKVCANHEKSWCDECKQSITSAHIHLDYVGHAELTARLLRLDPQWNWEPYAEDEDGLPRVLVSGSSLALWITLTVNGITRLGVGTADKSGGDSLKILIGDALRNAGMRFGLALDLWSKEDLDGGFGLDDTSSPLASPQDIERIRSEVDAIEPKERRDACKVEYREMFGPTAELRADEFAAALKFVSVYPFLNPQPGREKPGKVAKEEADGLDGSPDEIARDAVSKAKTAKKASAPRGAAKKAKKAAKKPSRAKKATGAPRDGPIPASGEPSDDPEPNTHEDPAAPEDGSVALSQGDRIRGQLVNVLIQLSGPYGLEVESALSDVGLWPIEDIPDDRAVEASDVVAPIAERFRKETSDG